MCHVFHNGVCIFEHFGQGLGMTLEGDTEKIHLGTCINGSRHHVIHLNSEGLHADDTTAHFGDQEARMENSFLTLNSEEKS